MLTCIVSYWWSDYFKKTEGWARRKHQIVQIAESELKCTVITITIKINSNFKYVILCYRMKNVSKFKNIIKSERSVFGMKNQRLLYLDS